jgi:hypothetical protein
MSLYGYARVSTIDQDLRLHRATLKAAGYPKRVSGSTASSSRHRVSSSSSSSGQRWSPEVFPDYASKQRRKGGRLPLVLCNLPMRPG